MIEPVLWEKHPSIEGERIGRSAFVEYIDNECFCPTAWCCHPGDYQAAATFLSSNVFCHVTTDTNEWSVVFATSGRNIQVSKIHTPPQAPLGICDGRGRILIYYSYFVLGPKFSLKGLMTLELDGRVVTRCNHSRRPKLGHTPASSPAVKKHSKFGDGRWRRNTSHLYYDIAESMAEMDSPTV